MRRRLVLSLSILLLAAAALSAWWWFGVNGVREAALAWAAERRAGGWTVAWDGVALGGFPLAWRLDFTGARLALPGRVEIGAPRLSVAVTPWAGQSLRVLVPLAKLAVFAGPAGSAYRADASALDMRVTQDRNDPRATVRLNARTAVVTRDDAKGRARVSDVVLNVEPATATKPADAREALRPPPLYRARLDVAGIALSPNPLPELGPSIEAASLDAVLHGALDGGPLRTELARWRDQGGVVEMDNLRVGWGDVLLSGDATVALDERLQPLIAGSMTLSGYSTALEALVQQGYVRADDAMAARLAFRLLQSTGTPAPRIPVTLQSGILSLGPAHVARVAPIAWPDFAL